jgi:hypothetical protein
MVHPVEGGIKHALLLPVCYGLLLLGLHFMPGWRCITASKHFRDEGCLQLKHRPWECLQQTNKSETRVASAWNIEHVFIGVRDSEVFRENLTIQVVLDEGDVICVSCTPDDLVEP